MKVKNKVPQIAKDQGISAEDLRWGAKLALNTAKRWVDPVEAQEIDRIDLTTLTNIASYLKVENICDMLELQNE
jgi:hypothetical protein